APSLLRRVLAREVGSYHRIEARARGRRHCGRAGAARGGGARRGQLRRPRTRGTRGGRDRGRSSGPHRRSRSCSIEAVAAALESWRRAGTRALPRQAIRCDSSSWPLLFESVVVTTVLSWTAV